MTKFFSKKKATVTLTLVILEIKSVKLYQNWSIKQDANTMTKFFFLIIKVATVTVTLTLRCLTVNVPMILSYFTVV